MIITETPFRMSFFGGGTDIGKLGGIIKGFDNNVANMGREISSNNAKFCDEFSKIVDKMFVR